MSCPVWIGPAWCFYFTKEWWNVWLWQNATCSWTLELIIEFGTPYYTCASVHKTDILPIYFNRQCSDIFTEINVVWCNSDKIFIRWIYYQDMGGTAIRTLTKCSILNHPNRTYMENIFGMNWLSCEKICLSKGVFLNFFCHVLVRIFFSLMPNCQGKHSCHLIDASSDIQLTFRPLMDLLGKYS